MTLTLESWSLPDDVVFDLLNRDSALWIGNQLPPDIELSLLARVATLPWDSVLIEPAAAELQAAITAETDATSALVRKRGYVHVIASDPAGIPLPPRCLPIYFLNGLQGAANKTESAALGAMAAQRRRLNMLGALQASGVKRLCFVGVPAGEAVQKLAELWEADFRCFASVAIAPEEAIPELPVTCPVSSDH